MMWFHFTQEDFDKCVPPCKLSDMSPVLMDKLEYARALTGHAFKITSAYRSPEYEIEKGRVNLQTGKPTSSHCKGIAVDISCYSDEYRYLFVQNLLRAGFTRIGIGKTFIHADIDYSKKSCIWLYD